MHLVRSDVEVLCEFIFTAYQFGGAPENLAMDLVARDLHACGLQQEDSAAGEARRMSPLCPDRRHQSAKPAVGIQPPVVRVRRLSRHERVPPLYRASWISCRPV